MTETKKRKKGGGKLTRSETVTVRLDPKLRYLSELAARIQRRTLSSYIEWTLQQSMEDVVLQKFLSKKEITLAEFAEDIWDVEPADRLLKLAFQSPSLMNFEEGLLFNVIIHTNWFWGGDQDRTLLDAKTNRVRRSWSAIKNRAEKEISQAEYIQLIKGFQESEDGEEI